MKTTFSTCMALFLALTMYSQSPYLVVESVDNDDFEGGNTYKVYLQFTDEDQTLHAVFGDVNDQIQIQTTTSFYQDELGTATSLSMNPNAFDQFPSLQYDSFVTLGASTSEENDIWNVGIDFENFESNSMLNIENGAWFVLPDVEQASADETNKILILQLTTNGVASGSLNFQGRDADGEMWQERNLTFTSDDAQVFGCTDDTANNYNAEATYDNGTCDFSVGISDADLMEDDIFQIYPNPISDGVISITFTSEISNKTDAVLNLYDQTGKLIIDQNINAEQLVAGSKIEINRELAPGVYTLQLRADEQVQQHRLVKE